VAVVQVGRGDGGDEELGAVGAVDLAVHAAAQAGVCRDHFSFLHLVGFPQALRKPCALIALLAGRGHAGDRNLPFSVSRFTRQPTFGQFLPSAQRHVPIMVL